MRDIGIVPAHIVWLCKGFEADTQCLPNEVVAAELPQHASNGTLSGPSFAREVGQGLPVALTVASASAVLGERTVAAFHHGAMRIYTGDDVIGVEVGGAVKNVLAIATGICRRPRPRSERARRADHARSRGNVAARRGARRPRGNLHRPDRASAI